MNRISILSGASLSLYANLSPLAPFYVLHFHFFAYAEVATLGEQWQPNLNLMEWGPHSEVK